MIYTYKYLDKILTAMTEEKSDARAKGFIERALFLEGRYTGLADMIETVRYADAMREELNAINAKQKDG